MMTTWTPPPRLTAYRPDIDGLRAIAVLLVLVFHFDLFSIGKAGFIGVDVFYVISGFLITSIILGRMEDEKFSFADFYLRRIRRLAPALFAVLMLVLAAGALWLFPHELVELVKQVLASQVYVANFYYWKSINYFGLRADDVYLLHTWSLAVEEQFYIVYPAIILVIYKFARRYLPAILVLGFLFSFALNLYFVGSKPEATFYLLPTRAWELLLGAFILFLVSKFEGRRVLNEVFGLLGMALIVVAVVTYRDDFEFPGYFALLPTFGGALLILSGSNAPTSMYRILSLRPVVYVGNISYSLYLVHWPINVFAAQLWGEDYSRGLRFLMFGGSFALSILLFHLVENPFRRRSVFKSGRTMAIGYAAGIALTIVAFMTVETTRGLPQRFPDEVLRLASFVDDHPDTGHCTFPGRGGLQPKDFCTIGDLNKSPDWVIFGDSHAWAASEAFNVWLKRRHKSALFMFSTSCPPVFGIYLFKDDGRCYAFNGAMSEFLAAAPEIKNVVLISIWIQPKTGRVSVSPDSERLPPEESAKLFSRQFSSTVEKLRTMGKNVLVWEPVPGARANVPIAMARAALTGHGSDIRFSKRHYLDEYGFFFDALSKVRDLVSVSFSPSELLCSGGKCEVSHDGVPLYVDGNHISKSSAEFWAAFLDRQFKQKYVTRSDRK